MREFLHVDDLADACLFLMDRYDEPGHINVGTGVDITIKELAETVRSIVYPAATLVWDTLEARRHARKVLDVAEAAGPGLVAEDRVPRRRALDLRVVPGPGPGSAPWAWPRPRPSQNWRLSQRVWAAAAAGSRCRGCRVTASPGRGPGRAGGGRAARPEAALVFSATPSAMAYLASDGGGRAAVDVGVVAVSTSTMSSATGRTRRCRSPAT